MIAVRKKAPSSCASALAAPPPPWALEQVSKALLLACWSRMQCSLSPCQRPTSPADGQAGTALRTLAMHPGAARPLPAHPPAHTAGGDAAGGRAPAWQQRGSIQAGPPSAGGSCGLVPLRVALDGQWHRMGECAEKGGHAGGRMHDSDHGSREETVHPRHSRASGQVAAPCGEVEHTSRSMALMGSSHAFATTYVTDLRHLPCNGTTPRARLWSTTEAQDQRQGVSMIWHHGLRQSPQKGPNRKLAMAKRRPSYVS